MPRCLEIAVSKSKVSSAFCLFTIPIHTRILYTPSMIHAPKTYCMYVETQQKPMGCAIARRNNVEHAPNRWTLVSKSELFIIKPPGKKNGVTSVPTSSNQNKNKNPAVKKKKKTITGRRQWRPDNPSAFRSTTRCDWCPRCPSGMPWVEAHFARPMLRELNWLWRSWPSTSNFLGHGHLFLDADLTWKLREKKKQPGGSVVFLLRHNGAT